MPGPTPCPKADPTLAKCRRALQDHRARARADRQQLGYAVADLVRLAEAARTCAYCGNPLAPGAFTFDHIMPTARAADYRLSNLAVCCMACQLAKGVLSGEEFKALLQLLRGWHPRAGNDVLARLRAGGRRYRGGR